MNRHSIEEFAQINNFLVAVVKSAKAQVEIKSKNELITHPGGWAIATHYETKRIQLLLYGRMTSGEVSCSEQCPELILVGDTGDRF